MSNEEKDVVYAEMLEEHIMAIVLNQPKKRNAISAVMMDRLVDLLAQADADPEVRVVILRGAGEHFSSGGDLNQASPDEVGPEFSRKSLRRYEAALRAVRHCAKPIIAMVDGYAVGGAFALVLASDLVCVSERATFVPAFCQIGIIPEMGIMKYLPELVGPQRAKEILFLGESISGAGAAEMGLANRVFAHDALEAGTLGLARKVAEMPDASIQITKGLLNVTADGNLDALLEAETTASPFCTTTKAYAKTMERFAK